MMLFQDKVVWVTGASSGIGEALAYALSGQGARLVLSARRVDELERVRQQCANADNHLLLPLDLTNFDADAVTSRVYEQVGRVDALFHCGGVSQRSSVAETRMEIQRRIMEINYFGAVALTRAVLPAMIARKTGLIINFSSGWGRTVEADVAPYCASKWAIEGLTQALAMELPEGLGAIALNPGVINTDMLQICFGESAAHYPSATRWAESAVPFILKLDHSDNGQALTVPDV